MVGRQVMVFAVLVTALLTPGLAGAQAPRVKLAKAPVLKGRVVRRFKGLSAVGGRLIQVDRTHRISIRELAKKTFTTSSQLQQRLKVKATALDGAVKATDEVDETTSAYVIRRRVAFRPKRLSALTGDPAIRETLPDFRQFPTSYSRLSAREKRGVDRFIATEAKKLPVRHPLRRAARRGKDALLRAIKAGRGNFELEEEIIVPKKMLVMPSARLPGLAKLRLQRPRMVARGLTQPILPRVKHPEEPSTTNTCSGKGRAADYFLQGFTLGRRFEYKRKWKFPSGYFRFSAWAEIGFGLRFPFLVSGTVDPYRCRGETQNGTRRSYKVTIEAAALDASAAQMKAAGLDDAKLFGGKEFVLEAAVGYSVKLRAFWSTLLNKSGRFDLFPPQSRDFKPPLGPKRLEFFRYFIPAKYTKTKVTIGPFSGQVELGAKLEAVGTLKGNLKSIINGRYGATTTVDVSSGQAFRRYDLGVLKEGQQRYGYQFGDMSYRTDLVLTPGFQARVSAKYLGSKTYTKWLDALSIKLGSETFGRHKGTNQYLTATPGFRTESKVRRGDVKFWTKGTFSKHATMGASCKTAIAYRYKGKSHNRGEGGALHAKHLYCAKGSLVRIECMTHSPHMGIKKLRVWGAKCKPWRRRSKHPRGQHYRKSCETYYTGKPITAVCQVEGLKG